MYKYIISKHFKNQLKPYAKKFKGIFFDVINALIDFDKKRSIRLSGNIYKIRLSVTQLKRGKSKSFRLIVYLIEKDSLIVPIVIFSKNKKSNIPLKQIKKHASIINKEFKYF